MQPFRKIFLFLTSIIFIGIIGWFLLRSWHETSVLKKIIQRLEADTRVAEVLVTGVNFDEKQQKNFTTIKFLEYDSQGKPLESKYFSFSGNVIQFQSLVIRFDDIHVSHGDWLKGKSAHIFWKVFILDGENTQSFEINKIYSIPEGYKVLGLNDVFESVWWQRFWQYALDPKKASSVGIKNAQIEAPGMMFVPGYLYTLKIEHDGGLRIDAAPLPTILKGESII